MSTYCCEDMTAKLIQPSNNHLRSLARRAVSYYNGRFSPFNAKAKDERASQIRIVRLRRPAACQPQRQWPENNQTSLALLTQQRSDQGSGSSLAAGRGSDAFHRCGNGCLVTGPPCRGAGSTPGIRESDVSENFHHVVDRTWAFCHRS